MSLDVRRNGCTFHHARKSWGPNIDGLARSGSTAWVRPTTVRHHKYHDNLIGPWCVRHRYCVSACKVGRRFTASPCTRDHAVTELRDHVYFMFRGLAISWFRYPLNSCSSDPRSRGPGIRDLIELGRVRGWIVCAKFVETTKIGAYGPVLGF